MVENSLRRGRLKIYLGMSAGVGKTYAMLKDAEEELARGVDIVAGYIEAHGRKETEDLATRFEQIPCRVIRYHELDLREFDLEASLKRHPHTLLVDELAHSNAPGLLHAKRWLDVEALLAAGINVYTTLNIQHLESANDQVSALSGIKVQETVPDQVLRRADLIEVVDITPEDLIVRLKGGKIYAADKIQKALNNFFKEGTLLALREILLRKAAEKIDGDVLKFRQSTAVRDVWGTSDRMLVAIGPNRFAGRLVQKAARIAASRKCALSIIHVHTPHLGALSSLDQQHLDDALQAAHLLGATVEKRFGTDIVGEILATALQLNVALIVVGKPRKNRLQELLTGSLADALVRRSENIDVMLVAGEDDDTTQRPRDIQVKRRYWIGVLLSLSVVAFVTLLGVIIEAYVEESTIALLYVLGTVVAARYSGRAEAILASIASILAFNFLFIEPKYTLLVHNSEYLVTFVVMVIVSLSISGLVTRIRLQNLLMSERESIALLLYETGKTLNVCSSVADILRSAHAALARLPIIDCGVLMFVQGKLSSAVASRSLFELESQEIAVAKFVADKRRSAGMLTDTLPGAGALYLPIQTDRTLYGVCGLQFADENSARELMPTGELILQQAALCIERLALEEETMKSNLKIKSEAIRTTVLSAVSHDFRTPLTVIEGAAEQLAKASSATSREGDLSKLILEHSQRLSRMVNNALEFTRLESESLTLRREWESLEELVGQAIEKLRGCLIGRQITVNSQEDLPLVQIDAVLMDQLISNVIENSISHAPGATELEVAISFSHDQVRVEICDNGPGLRAESEAVFELRGDTQRHHGIGLGLQLCKLIAGLHGGSLFVFKSRGRRLSNSVGTAAERNAMTKKILVIEDEKAIHKLIGAAFTEEECQLLSAYSAEEGIRSAASYQPDLVILDLGLPGKTGFEVLAAIREWSQLPIIVLSARSDEASKIRALDEGANDYVTKPFSVGELLARIRASLRVSAAREGMDELLEAGPFHVEISAHIVRKNGQEIHLTPTEFKLFLLLVRNYNRVITHRQLLKDVWGNGFASDVQYLRVFMKQIRQKIEDTPSQPRFIVTEPGIGYRFKIQD